MIVTTRGSNRKLAEWIEGSSIKIFTDHHVEVDGEIYFSSYPPLVFEETVLFLNEEEPIAPNERPPKVFDIFDEEQILDYQRREFARSILIDDYLLDQDRSEEYLMDTATDFSKYETESMSERVAQLQAENDFLRTEHLQNKEQNYSAMRAIAELYEIVLGGSMRL